MNEARKQSLLPGVFEQTKYSPNEKSLQINKIISENVTVCVMCKKKLHILVPLHMPVWLAYIDRKPKTSHDQ